MSPSTVSTGLAALMPLSAPVRSWAEARDAFKASPVPLVLLCGVVAATLLTVSPVSMPELFIGAAGALAYAVTKLQKTTVTKKKSAKKIAASPAPAPPRDVQNWKRTAEVPRRSALQHALKKQQLQPKPLSRQESAKPVAQIHFKSDVWDAEVQELLCQITPNHESDQAVAKITEVAKKSIGQLIPEAEVVVVAIGNVQGRKAFGVAVPEVDVVVTAKPSAIVQRLQERVPNGAHFAHLDAKKLQKAAIRSCADQLVSGGFKFRRSAFRGEEPKFTFLAPTYLTSTEESLAIDLSVNSATPLQCAALCTECGQFDRRAKELILLLRRWARDRGIAHAARGHLSPYAWTLLAVYFLQVGLESDSAGLPSLDGMRDANGSPPGMATDLSIAELFKLCMQFYSSFDWRAEGVSVRNGRRSPPSLSLPLHITLGDDGKPLVAPSIEDPFNARRNMSSSMTAEGVGRFREEFTRASAMCKEGQPLAKLLELWAPPAESA